MSIDELGVGVSMGDGAECQVGKICKNFPKGSEGCGLSEGIGVRVA